MDNIKVCLFAAGNNSVGDGEIDNAPMEVVIADSSP